VVQRIDADVVLFTVPVQIILRFVGF